MRIAFYAPLKPPDHPVPSGDRRMAQLLWSALAMSGYQVALACRFCSFDGQGIEVRQERLGRIGLKLAERLLDRYRNRPPASRPEIWFTYHLYHKAPDWLGPFVSRGLHIPYVVAEASYAPKQESGRWAFGCHRSREAIAQAGLVVGLNTADAPCVKPLLAEPSRWLSLPPFIDAATLHHTAGESGQRRHEDAAEPLLLAVAMMRRGDKLASYRLLAEALGLLADRRWRLVIVGDGPARDQVEQAFAPLRDRVTFLGERTGGPLCSLYATADLYLWPAIGEAYGIALLEAQALGLPVVAGRCGGVPDVVADGVSGLLVAAGDPDAFAQAVAALLDDPDRRRTLGRKAADRVEQRHDLKVAAPALANALAALGCGSR
jgi:glycosyltransferase involved in cell wall biosynthesis